MSRDQGSTRGRHPRGPVQNAPIHATPAVPASRPGIPATTSTSAPATASATASAPGGETAGHARTILAGARHALLTLPTGCRRPGKAGERGWVGLVDDGGEPVLLARAASSPALATVSGSTPARTDVPGPAGERLILAGTLVRVPGPVETVLAAIQAARPSSLAVVPDDDPDTLVALRLTVSEVLLSVPAPAGTGGGQHSGVWGSPEDAQRVALDSYALAEPDLITAYAPDLVTHLNEAHGDVLRAIAIRTAPDDLDIAGAWVSDLDREGLTMWRVVPSGAEPVRLRFHEPLTEPRALGAELRRMLRRAPADGRGARREQPEP
jgi:Protein of unknown function (DUF2470)